MDFRDEMKAAAGSEGARRATGDPAASATGVPDPAGVPGDDGADNTRSVNFARGVRTGEGRTTEMLMYQGGSDEPEHGGARSGRGAARY